MISTENSLASVTLSEQSNINREFITMILAATLVGTSVTWPAHGLPSIDTDKSIIYSLHKNPEVHSPVLQNGSYVTLVDFARELERRSTSLSPEESELWYEEILAMSEPGILNF
jgi:hypothetical protein